MVVVLIFLCTAVLGEIAVKLFIKDREPLLIRIKGDWIELF
jgi:hypothetical protein